MKTRLFCSLIALCSAFVSMNAEGTHPQIINVDARQTISLDGEWHYIVDPQSVGSENLYGASLELESSFFADKDYHDDPTKLVEYSFDSSPTLQVPGDWNTQDPKLYYYEGVMWYCTHFNYTKKEGQRVFLYFGAVNYLSEVALNGTFLGSHEGGFTPFNFEVTDILKDGENSLVVRVDNARDASRVPCEYFDWWNYGGITRSVKLIECPKTFVREYALKLDKTPIGKARKGQEATRKIYGYVVLDGGMDYDISVSIPELGASVKVKPDASGRAEFSFNARPTLWTPENPKLYNVEISAGIDKITDKIGFRYVEVQGKQILLNGTPIYLRGTSMHEESIGSNPGRIRTDVQNRELLSLAKEMNCNFARLAHYPYNEGMIRAADEMGVLLWEEIPVYWAVDWNNEDTYKNAENQLKEMITRDINRACTIIWSVANETPEKPERLTFLCKLIDKAREWDGTRLVSAALLTKWMKNEKLTVLKDPLAQYTDILSFNVYFGWYRGGDAEVCDDVKWEFAYQKPIIISEFGAGAKYGKHDKEDNVRFSEEYMRKCYEYNTRMFDRLDGLCGTTPWILKDFRSPRRPLAGIQDDFNRKGLVSEDGKKKSAFYVMQDWYKTK